MAEHPAKRPASELTDELAIAVYVEKRQYNAVLNTIHVENAIAKLRTACYEVSPGDITDTVTTAGIPENVEPAERLAKSVPGEYSFVWRLERGTLEPRLETPSKTMSLSGIDSAPEYETCPVPSTNHLIDWSDGDSIDFIPLPDDNGFPPQDFLLFKVEVEGEEQTYRKECKWETMNRNVRDDQAVRDAANALIEEYEITEENLKELFESIWLLQDYQQIMNYSPVYRERLDLSQSVDGRSIHSLRQFAAEYMQAHYCLLPHCRMVDCVHVQARKQLNVPCGTPQRVATGVQKSPTIPCGENCYMQHLDVDDKLSEDWDEDRLSQLKDVVNLYPSDPSCDLAIWCGTTCRQFDLQRYKLLGSTVNNIPPSKTTRAQATARRAVTTAISKVVKSANPRPGYPFFVPCQHEGPCERDKGCVCFNTLKRCERWCGCSDMCARRFRGCNCRNSKGCLPDHCPCLKEGRECDLSVCHNGAYSLGTEDDRCKNVSIQNNRGPVVTVKPGRYGWGLFLEESVVKGRFIGEYLGELMTHDREDREYGVADYIGRSYAFSVSDGWSINSANLGNETRFINHSYNVSMLNVDAKHLIVNGDVRLGFFTTKAIRKGSELYFNYGDNFFIHEEATDANPQASSEDEVDKRQSSLEDEVDERRSSSDDEVPQSSSDDGDEYVE